MITLISAMGKKNEIGVNNTLLWDLPVDMQHFRTRTRNKTVVMGRKTFESIGMELPQRTNIVVTHNREYDVSQYKNTKCMYSLQEVLDLHAKEVKKNSHYEMMIIGGSTLYEMFLSYATHLSLTFVDAEFPEADSFFPTVDFTQFELLSCQNISKDENNRFDIKICEFQRVLK